MTGSRPWAAETGYDLQHVSALTKIVTLKRCIRGAFNVPELQIIGGPKRVDQDRYYIEAEAPLPSGEHDLMLMLQALLADRFQLVFHREQGAAPGYRPVLAKGGLKAQASAPVHDSVGRSQRGRIEDRGYTVANLPSSGRKCCSSRC